MAFLGRPTALRYLGFAGSLLLAATAVRLAALPGRADADSVPGRADSVPALAAALGLVLLTTAWWQAGRLAQTGRWMLVTAGLWAAPMLVCPPLMSRDIYSYACQGALVNASIDPHAAGPAALPCPWLSSVPPVWRDSPSPYGPLASLLSAAATKPFGHHLGAAIIMFRLLALIGIGIGIWAGRRLALACHVPPATAAWLALACPLISLHAVGGAHLDALVTGLLLAAAAVALPAGSGPAGPGLARRAGLAGVAIGLACAGKVTALVALPFIALLLIAGTPWAVPAALTRWRLLAALTALVSAVSAATFGILAVASGLGFGFLRGLGQTSELAQWTSPPTAVGMSIGYGFRQAGWADGFAVAVSATRLLGLIAGAVVIAGAWWWAARQLGAAPAETRTAPAAHLVPARILIALSLALATVALAGPVFYPWYAIAPLAFAAVCLPARSRLRPWLAAAAGVGAFLVLPNGVGLAPLTKLPGALVVTAALIAASVAIDRAARRGTTPGDPIRPSDPIRSGDPQ